MINVDQVIIRKLAKDDDLEFITLLIRSAYKSLLDKGFKYWGTHQTVEDTKTRFKNSDAFIVEYEGNITGTISLKSENPHKETSVPWHDKDEVSFFTQFAVNPKYQKSGLGSKMMNFIEQFAKGQGFTEIALDTC